jgi:hypothetical protein
VIKSRRVGGIGHVAHIEEMRNAYKILVGKPERPRRYEDNIKTDLIEIRWEVGWIHLAQDRDQ